MLSKKTLLIIQYLVFCIYMISCQPRQLIKIEQPSGVDSVLFFEGKEISDPFLENLKNEIDSEIKLKTRLIPPPPPPPPNYREVDGFRVQVFAGLDSINAFNTKIKVQTATYDSVYLVNEGGLVKIQVGDFLYRVDADNQNMQLRRAGFSGSWVVPKKIRVPLEESREIPTDSTASIKSEAHTEQDSVKFRIQVLATGDLDRAQQLKIQLQNRFGLDSWFEEAGGLYKVYLGKFSERANAEEVLKKVREDQYPDAWLVY
jgi:cell division septation protein DedD